MWYRKNVGRAEGWGRLLAGALMTLCGFFGLNLSLLGWVPIGSGIFTAMTGVVGYCPACAIAGRKLPLRS